MLQGVTAFFAYMWWWLSCRMAELLDFFFYVVCFIQVCDSFLSQPLSSKKMPCQQVPSPPSCSPLLQLVQFQLHYRPPTTQNILLPEGLLWFISQMSNSKSIWTVKHSLDFSETQFYRARRTEISWSSGTVYCGAWAKGFSWARVLRQRIFLIETGIDGCQMFNLGCKESFFPLDSYGTSYMINVWSI